MQSSKVKSQNYNPSEIESRWQKKWEEEKIYSPNLETAKKPFYNLMMFPYPSAEGMHVGNMYAFTGADVYGRFQRMQGFSVFEPIGLDGFGIHSENYAIKAGNHPVEQAKISEKNYYKQLRAIGGSFDWTRTVETYKPEYYKWTQWLFIQLFKAGLAYRKKAPVNFCPSCKTVLADEQVVKKFKVQSSKFKVEEEVNVCERCGTEVEKRDLEQWFFKITKYADRLLDNLTQIDWDEKVKIAQKQWIGKSEGALIRFKIKDLRFKNQDVEVFTTRPDTLFGATFLVLSPEHSAVASILRGEFDVARPRLAKLKSYVEKAKKKTGLSDETLVKSGVFSGLYAINPVNNEKIPVWIADYVLMGYGTGAIMAVPAHDQRDFEFAKKYDLPIRVVIARGPVAPSSRPTSSVASSLRSLDGTPSSRATPREAYSGEGKIINSGEWDGWKTPDSIEKVLAWLEKKGLGKKEANYHLRDWLISRQRYWGPPIPMIYCEDCKWQPVPEKDLPVKLPFIEDYKPLGTGAAPLASHPEFYKTKCPNCKKPAKRETDVSDTFLDSAWYFLRYVSTDIDSTAFDAERVKKWLPVNMYIGGAEHSVLHLLYSRFITMALHDLGYFSFEEPFTRFRAHGLIIKDGAKMSKSKGNVVIPDEYIRKFGADTLRAYLMFSGPFDQGGDFRDSGIEGMSRFLRRVWVLANNVILSNAKDLDSSTTSQNDREKQQMMHKTIKKVTEDIANLSYNTAIAALMEYYNFLSEQKAVTKEEVETYLKLLAPFAPHMTEELFQNVILRAKPEGSHEILRSAQNDNDYLSIHLSEWPKFDPKFLEEDEVVIAVQVNGKLRNVLKVQRLKTKDQKYIEQLARSSAKVYKYLEGKKIIKVIYIEGRIINFVI